MSATAPSSAGIPSAPPTFIGRPVRGATLAGMADANNHFAGWRGRRAHHAIWWSPSFAVGDANDGGDVWGDGTRTEDALMVMPTSPLARHLAVVIVACAYATGGSSPPAVRARIEKQDGTVIDSGCEWTRSDGTFAPVELPAVNVLVGLAYVQRYPVRPVIIETGRTPRDGLHGTGLYSPPRLLYLDGHGGEVLVLRVSATAAQVLSVVAYEHAEDVI